MLPLWRPVIIAALAAALWSSPANTDRKFGCLFEDELCATYEFCVNDGVFGRCQALAGADLRTYDISSSGLQHLRILLQKLAHRGLTWQDDITQQAVSRELSTMRTSPLRHQTTASNPVVTYSSSRDGNLRSAQSKMNNNLHEYLTRLGFLPQVEEHDEAQVQHEGFNIQNGDISTDDQFKPNQPKPKTGWKETTIYSHHNGDGKPPVTKVFTQSGEGRHPKLSNSFIQYPGKTKLLSSHLEQLLAAAPSHAQDTPAGEASQAKGKLPKSDYQEPQAEDVFSSKPQRPSLDRLLFKANSNRPNPKQPFSDERFIQNMVNQLGRHSFHHESFMGEDLDHLAKVISGALKEVDKDQHALGAQPRPGATNERVGVSSDKDYLPAVDLKQEQDLTVKQQGQQREGADKEPTDKHSAFLSKLLEYLDMQPFDDAPEVNSGPKSSLHKMVGLESVQSRTTEDRVSIPHPWVGKVASIPRKEGLTQLWAGPGPQVGSEIEKWMQKDQSPAGIKQPEKLKSNDIKVQTQLIHVGVKEFSSRGKDRHFGYIITGSDSLTSDQGSDLMERLTQRLNLHVTDLTQLSVLGPALTFRVGPNPKNISTADLVQVAVQEKQQLEKETGLKIVEAGVSDRGSLTQIPVVKETRVESGQFLVLTILCSLFILVAVTVSATVFCVRQRSHLRMKEKLASLGTDTNTDATTTYQDLCRQRMAIRTSERVERPETLRHSRLNSVSSQFSDGPAASPSTRSSTSSWCEEPVPSNMDISTGHMILSYMEDHLKNKNRLEREWEALCSYQAEPSACSVGQGEQNARRNRSDAVVVYDHSRITLKVENNHSNSDYINASPIMDHDPRNPTYITSQGPLASTVADFWQMVWESGCVVIVMLTPLSENGVKQCHHYWPDEGSDVYHIYEVNLVSEHIWCEDFLVRSFYLKNLQTNETRTVTQFHFLSWMDRGNPSSARTLLDFRRKVNKCYRGRSCPIIVHCSDGAGRSGTYILIDMVLNRMAKGAKEIDIAATLEHLRDQRAGMVQTKEQFEFALTAVAEEVNAILKALPQ
ncbi:receptor-type tyrosine-protein phosphatase N2 [Gouania willdenowi]|uniref:Protein tyrosine phosphatase receptor type N2 n=1 Tax=Gouania willdenowi TaxID=441366 RepID=A0A8C5HMM6_GOUWI|nr:receptor-type tyrosine-protein phosphatase N2 [Gouania willdenowi]